MEEMVDSREIQLVQALKKSKESKSKMENAISAALLSEQLVDDLKLKMDNTNDLLTFTTLKEQNKALKAESLFLVEQRQAIQETINVMKQDSDSVKAKFTRLLDEF